MTVTKKRFKSPSTPSVNHDLTNFLVEAILINRYGSLPEGCWRKGQALASEWSKLLIKVRRITNNLGVEAEQLAWFIKFYKVTNLDYKDFGLLRWKIRKYFKWCNLNNFATYYTKLQEQATTKSSSYVENTTEYKTKEAGGKKRTLSDILKELEDAGDE